MLRLEMINKLNFIALWKIKAQATKRIVNIY
jgi:hypothetical protein